MINDPVFGDAEIEGPRFQLHRTPHVETRRGPRIGEHTNEILAAVGGLSQREIEQLADAGVLS